MALEEPLVVSVEDRAGNPVSGVTVAWSVEEGPGELSRNRSTSDGQGRASVTVTPTDLGVIRVVASVDGANAATFEVVGHSQRDDPTSDTFETELSAELVAPDIVRMAAWPEPGVLAVELVFAEAVAGLPTGGPNVVVGILDVDVDEDPTTGVVGGADAFNPAGPSSGLGVDYVVELAGGASGRMRVLSAQGRQTGSLLPEFAENLLTLRIPLGALGGDDGRVALAVVVGTQPEATDVAPDVGSLSMGSGSARSADRPGSAGRGNRVGVGWPRVEVSGETTGPGRRPGPGLP